MDVPRDSDRPRRRLVGYALAAMVVTAITLFISTLQPGVPVVNRELLAVGTVRYGSMTRRVHGWGRLLPDRLTAEIKVYAAAASEVEVGQSVSLSTAAGMFAGHVSDVAGRAGEKLFAVTVTLDENPPIPPEGNDEVGAHIHLETIDDVLYVERPFYAEAGGTTNVFRVTTDATSAARVEVKFGRGSADQIEVLSGLSPGDRIVVSDVSGFEDLDSFDIE